MNITVVQFSVRLTVMWTSVLVTMVQSRPVLANSLHCLCAQYLHHTPTNNTQLLTLLTHTAHGLHMSMENIWHFVDTNSHFRVSTNFPTQLSRTRRQRELALRDHVLTVQSKDFLNFNRPLYEPINAKLSDISNFFLKVELPIESCQQNRTCIVLENHLSSLPQVFHLFLHSFQMDYDYKAALGKWKC